MSTLPEAHESESTRTTAARRGAIPAGRRTRASPRGVVSSGRRGRPARLAARVWAAAAAIGLTACGSGGPSSPPPPGNGHDEVAFVNGSWLDGDEFTPRTAYAVDGVLTFSEPVQIDRTVDLDGGYVVPPFAEAHTHTLVDMPDARIPEFLGAGILYAGVMNTFRSVWEANGSRFDTPTSVDVIAAIAGLTASNGHPVQIGLRTGATLAEIDGDWVHVIDSPQDLADKWPSIAGSGTDLVKVFLVNSDEYDERFADPDVSNRYRGLDPDLLPEIVMRAGQEGLPVVAHVRTAPDFRAALDAGVDVIAHLPGFSMGPGALDEVDDPRLLAELDDPDRFLLTAADAQKAAADGVGVMTTVLGITEVPPGLTPALQALVQKAIDVSRSVQHDNLVALDRAGVTILLGSDAGEQNVVDEVLYIDGLGVFNEAELLRLLTEVTPRALFPGRQIGRLQTGYEASFVVLGSDPLADLGAIRDVELLVKRGEPL